MNDIDSTLRLRLNRAVMQVGRRQYMEALRNITSAASTLAEEPAFIFTPDVVTDVVEKAREVVRLHFDAHAEWDDLKQAIFRLADSMDKIPEEDSGD